MFEDLTGVGAKIAGSVHVLAPIVLEKSLFGGVVWTLWLQQHLGVSEIGRVLGVVLAGEYLFHFAAPLVAGLWLWLRHRDRFGTFVGAYVMVMAAGFLVYLLYPEMPPRLAAQNGDLPPVHRIVVETLQRLGSFGTFYAGADPEPNAAMPSLHVAVPMVIACAVVAVRGVRRPSPGSGCSTRRRSPSASSTSASTTSPTWWWALRSASPATRPPSSATRPAGAAAARAR